MNHGSSGIPVEVRGIKPEWSMFKTSTERCGLRVIGASRGGESQTSWWTLVDREDVQLRKESFRDMLSPETPEAVARY